jgi:hypothetical protein
MRALIVVFCLLGATGCDERSPLAPTVPLNERFTLARGEAAIVRELDLRLEFVQVTGDSRCPVGAGCILGGDAIVHVRASEPGTTPVDYELHTADPSRAAVVHRQARIELVELQPFPFSGRTIEQDEYRATLAVTRP